MSLAHHGRGEAMTPRELVEDALRRLTDGSLTFRLAEDEYTVAALFDLDGRAYSHMWSKALLGYEPSAAEQGVHALLAKANA